MKFGSLFSGIAGLDLGLERAGMECAWQVENDPYCLKVLAKHWPNVTRYEDIREVDFGRVEPVDLLAGGFPCQDLSYAGKGAGLSGERSGLWGEFVRAIRLVRPRYVLVENVPGLLSRGMGVVLGDLCALGYNAEWESIPAAAFGAPHLRWRVFIVAYTEHSRRRESARHSCTAQRALHPPVWEEGASRVGPSCEDVVHPRCQCNERRGETGNLSGASGKAQGEGLQRQRGWDSALDSSADVPDSDRSGRTQQWRSVPVFAQHTTPERCSWWEVEPDVGRVASGISSRVDRLRGLGNAVVPAVAQWLGEQIIDHAND